MLIYCKSCFFGTSDLVVAAANTGKVVNLKRTIYESHETCSTEGFRLPNENGMVDRGTMFDTKI
jgi:3-deoxy-D-manno-octulosonic acid (KDO) 8-phosphate synthase